MPHMRPSESANGPPLWPFKPGELVSIPVAACLKIGTILSWKWNFDSDAVPRFFGFSDGVGHGHGGDHVVSQGMRPARADHFLDVFEDNRGPLAGVEVVENQALDGALGAEYVSEHLREPEVGDAAVDDHAVGRSAGRIAVMEMVDRMVGRLQTTHGRDTRAEDMVGDGNRVNERGQVGGGTGNGAEGDAADLVQAADQPDHRRVGLEHRKRHDGGIVRTGQFQDLADVGDAVGEGFVDEGGHAFLQARAGQFQVIGSIVVAVRDQNEIDVVAHLLEAVADFRPAVEDIRKHLGVSTLFVPDLHNLEAVDAGRGHPGRFAVFRIIEIVRSAALPGIGHVVFDRHGFSETQRIVVVHLRAEPHPMHIATDNPGADLFRHGKEAFRSWSPNYEETGRMRAEISGIPECPGAVLQQHHPGMPVVIAPMRRPCE